MHHLNAAACQTETERPHGAVARPRYELVDRCSVCRVPVSLMVCSLHPKFAAHAVYSARPIGLISDETANVEEVSAGLVGLNECF